MTRTGLSYRFTHAIARTPARSVGNGLRAVDRGTPEADLFKAEHRTYVNALERAGLNVTVLEALEDFPDSVFIEDAALCLPEGAVILRPGTATRTGEAALLDPDLSSLGMEIHPHNSDGFIDGGDILVTDSVVLVGLSGRTNLAGFNGLKSLLETWGYKVVAVETPAQVLHFKSDCCVLDSTTILATSRLSKEACFASFSVLTVPPGEEPAANSIRVNDTVLIPAGFPATAEMLAREGYSIKSVPVTQASLLDGGLSCMSLRFSCSALPAL
jgi:dimethylargininase